MLIESQAADPKIHAPAESPTRECQNEVQACLREEEWRDADTAFYRVIRAGLESLKAGKDGR